MEEQTIATLAEMLDEDDMLGHLKGFVNDLYSAFERLGVLGLTGYQVSVRGGGMECCALVWEVRRPGVPPYPHSPTLKELYLYGSIVTRIFRHGGILHIW